MLWEVDIYAAEGQPDLGARDVAAAAAELHIISHPPLGEGQGVRAVGQRAEGGGGWA
jgi:hypothetical protein